MFTATLDRSADGPPPGPPGPPGPLEPVCLLQVRGVGKSFPGVVALDDVQFRLRPGSVHALLGENGAGKSTLMKIIAGVYAPDRGEILLRGQPVTLASPRDALDHGIAMIHQELNLMPEMKHSSSNQHGGQPIADPLQPPDEAVGGLGGILAVEPLCRTPRPILDTRFIRCGWRVALWKTEMKHSSSNRHGGQPIADPLQPPDEAVGGLGGILAVEPLCRTPRPILDTRFIRCGWRVALWKTEMKHSSSNRHGGQPIADPLQPPDEAVGGLGGILAVEPLCRTPRPILDTRFIRCGWRVALWKTEMKHSSSNQHGGQPIADPLQPPDEAVGGLGGILAVEPLCRTPRPILDTRFIRCGWRVALWKTEMKHSSSNQHGGQPIADPLQPPDEAVGGLGGILAASWRSNLCAGRRVQFWTPVSSAAGGA